MRRWPRVLVPALLLCGAQPVPAVVCSLYYYGCVRPGALEQPEVTVVGRLDGEEFSYYDSTQRNVTPRQGWVRQLEDPEGWKTNTHVLEASLQIYRTAVRERQGPHTVLLLCGCELEEDGGGTSRGRCALGHEGKVYLRLDTRTRTWTQVSRAPGAEQGWEPDRSFTRTVLTFLEQYCSQWLKIFIKHARKTLCREPSSQNVWMADKNTIFMICTTAFYVLIAALVICCVKCESGFFKKSTRHQPSAARQEGHELEPLQNSRNSAMEV